MYYYYIILVKNDEWQTHTKHISRNFHDAKKYCITVKLESILSLQIQFYATKILIKNEHKFKLLISNTNYINNRCSWQKIS